jgi:hypothetical protein
MVDKVEEQVDSGYGASQQAAALFRRRYSGNR